MRIAPFTIAAAALTALAVLAPAAAHAETVTFKDPKLDVRESDGDPTSDPAATDLRKVTVKNGKKDLTFIAEFQNIRTQWWFFAVAVDPKGASTDALLQFSFHRTDEGGPIIERFDSPSDTTPDFVGYGNAVLEYGEHDRLTLTAPRKWFKATADDPAPKQVRINAVVNSSGSSANYVDLLLGWLTDDPFPFSDWIKPAT